MKKRNLGRWNRREVFQASALGLLGAGPAAPAARTGDAAVYTKVGYTPFINLTATYTINGGALTLPEVKQAMEEASHFPVNLDELMEKVGGRIAELLGSESAIVTSGAAAALTHATAACVAGADPEKMQQLPNVAGLKGIVLAPKQSRNAYDHAVRLAGVRMVEFDTPDEYHRLLGNDVAMVMVLGKSEPEQKIRLEEIAALAHKRGVPVLVDAAAELPLKPNPYLSRGASLVAYSGGKIIRGPQCAGLLLGRKDLVAAAWINSSPHHALGRPMKVGKEEIMGMLAAIEVFSNKRDLEADYKLWTGWLNTIADGVRSVPGVTTKLSGPAGASPFPTMQVDWDPNQTGITAGEVGEKLLHGTPRIMSHAEGEGFGFRIRPISMQPGDDRIVAKRLSEILRAAPKGRQAPALQAPVTDVSGEWEIDIEFVSGWTRHRASFDAAANNVAGTYRGRVGSGAIKGTLDGEQIQFRSAIAYEGTSLSYRFEGTVNHGRMSGEVSLGEYGKGRWTARRA